LIRPTDYRFSADYDHGSNAYNNGNKYNGHNQHKANRGQQHYNGGRGGRYQPQYQNEVSL
jgi:hypothetical protein